MAGRRGPKPAKDRLAAATFTLDTAAGLIRVHVKVCDRCARARGDVTRFCDEGYQLAKGWTRARNRREKLQREISGAGRQLELFS